MPVKKEEPKAAPKEEPKAAAKKEPSPVLTPRNRPTEEEKFSGTR